MAHPGQATLDQMNAKADAARPPILSMDSEPFEGEPATLVGRPTDVPMKTREFILQLEQQLAAARAENQRYREVVSVLRLLLGTL